MAVDRLFRVIDPQTGPRWATQVGPAIHAVEDVFAEPEVGVMLGDSLPRTVGVAPSKIVCIGRNYAAHALELGHAIEGEPVLFLKPPSSLLAHGEPIVRPRAHSGLVHHEGELGVVVGQRLRNATRSQAREAIWGLIPANDVTARDLQRADKNWARGKGFDSFCPVGPEVVFAHAAPPIEELELTVTVNGDRRQHARCDAMLFPVDACLAYASRFFTLEPGDLLLTGTPEGVGPLEDGDLVTVTIEGVGALANPVVDGPAPEELPDWRQVDVEPPGTR